MTSPLGVSRLIDLLEEEREVVRNGTSITIEIHRFDDRAQGLTRSI